MQSIASLQKQVMKMLVRWSQFIGEFNLKIIAIDVLQLGFGIGWCVLENIQYMCILPLLVK